MIGDSPDRVDGVAKVTGAARYVGDLVFPRMLHAKVLRSPLPHARILRINGPAGETDGLVTLTRADLELMDPYYGIVVKDQPIVAVDRVRYVGDPVAAVAAERIEAAEEALQLFDVEYEPLDVVSDMASALLPEAPILHPHRRMPETVVYTEMRSLAGRQESNVCSFYRVEQGDVDAAFAVAKHVFVDTYTVPAIQHGHLEPHAAVAQWENGGLVVHTSTQNPSVVRAQLAGLFALPETRVRVIVPYVGGGFGGKLYLRLEPIVAALAQKAGRPVKLVLTREEVFATLVRHAARVRLKTAVDGDGTLLAREASAQYDTGAYADIGPRTAKNGGYVANGPYRIDHQRLSSESVYTNSPPAGAFRGFGVPQVCWAHESQLDRIAHQLNLDPVDVRRRNLIREGDIFVTGDRLLSVGLDRCLDQVAGAIGWHGIESTHPIESGEADVVRGLGVAVMIKSTMTPSHSAASIRLNADGSAILMTSSVEIGQGAHTALAQIVSETLGLPIHQVAVTFPDTDYTPYDSNTSSSRTIFSMGNAARQAAQQIRDELCAIAAARLEIAAGDLEIVDGLIRVRGNVTSAISIPDALTSHFGTRVGSLFGSHAYQTRGGLDSVTGKGKASAFWFLSACGAEVEVDKRTGRVTVLRAVTAVDVGRAISPRQCWLQNEGSMLMGLGSALVEELLYDGGQPLNASFLSYLIPSIEDFPTTFESILIETPHPEGPYGAKGVGEAAIAPVAPAIGNAVAHALGGVWFPDLPLTPERVLTGILEHHV